MTPSRIPKIALDAGHGLTTPGKQTPDGIKEWDLNDRVRDKIAAILSNYYVEIVHLDNDEGSVDEPLIDRLRLYKKLQVCLVASIHHNATIGKWNTATGVEVFTDRNPTQQDLKLANLIYNKLVNYTGLKGRGIKQANFTIINQNSIPAVLIEGGFMDGTNDYIYITSNNGQAAYARAVAEAIIEFLNLQKKEITMENKFVDINQSFAKKDINELFEMGIVNGKTESRFMPTETVTREELAAVIRRTIRYITGK